MNQNIYLVGPMGSGKSSIGQRLAGKLGLDFVDCDTELEKRTGASVNLIFDVEGESGFRDRETALLQELTARSNVLIATGGGAVLREENRKLLQSSGLVVYLRTAVRQQLQRLQHDKSRPLLQTPDREARLEALAEKRNPLYESVADMSIPSTNRSLEKAADLLAQSIRDFQKTGELPAHG